MKQHIKRALVLFVICAVAMGLTGCGSNVASNSSTAPSVDTTKYTETITVYNASEYIDPTTITEFQKKYAVKVEYLEFESNEDLYDEVSKNPNGYDVLVPSDYMIDRMIKEGKLSKLDKSKLPSMSFVAEEYLKPAYDINNDYAVPYMVGTLGILYDKRRAGPVDSWSVLFDSKNAGKVLMLDSQRDTIGITLKMLGYSMNSVDDAELAEAKVRLQSVRSIATYQESEAIRDRMVAGEYTMGVVYSGDAKIAIDRNPQLGYVIPKEGSNKWGDCFVITKGSKHLDAAHKFIDFMCQPNIAVRNMTEIGYTSSVAGAWGEFNSNKIMFPSVEELTRCEAFLYNATAAQKYDKLWSSVR
jgi:spermidine/putrescine transport system substrate-binding protein